MIRAVVLAIAMLAALAPGIAFAQLMSLGIGAGGAAPSTGTPCTAGAIDLSLATGCNIPQYLGGVFP